MCAARGGRSGACVVSPYVARAQRLPAEAKGERWQLALQLMQYMRWHGFWPDVISFNAAITGCERGQAWEWALQLLEEMQRSMRDPDVISYSAAISACEKGPSG